MVVKNPFSSRPAGQSAVKQGGVNGGANKSPTNFFYGIPGLTLTESASIVEGEKIGTSRKFRTKKNIDNNWRTAQEDARKRHGNELKGKKSPPTLDLETKDLNETFDVSNLVKGKGSH